MTVRFILEESLRILRRNHPLLIIGMSFLLLTLLGASFVGGLLATGIHDRIFKPVEIDVYLSNGLNKERISSLEKIFESLGGVDRVQFISKTKAKKIFEGTYPDYAELLELFPESPFPESFKLVLKPHMTKEKWISDLVEKISLLPGVEEVYYPSKELSKANKWLQLLLLSAFTAILFILFAVAFTIFYTMKTMSKGEILTIKLMELLGSTSFSIKLPYFIFGLLIGFLSGILAILPLYLLIIFTKNILGITINPLILLILPLIGSLLSSIGGYSGAGDAL